GPDDGVGARPRVAGDPGPPRVTIAVLMYRPEPARPWLEAAIRSAAALVDYMPRHAVAVGAPSALVSDVLRGHDSAAAPQLHISSQAVCLHARPVASCGSSGHERALLFPQHLADGLDRSLCPGGWDVASAAHHLNDLGIAQKDLDRSSPRGRKFEHLGGVELEGLATFELNAEALGLGGDRYDIVVEVLVCALVERIPCGEIEGAAVHDELVSREVDDRHVHWCESDDIVFSFSERELTVRSIRYPRAGHHDRFRDQVGGVGSGLGQRLDMEHADVLLEPGVHLGIAGSFGPGDEGPNPDRDHKQAYSNGAKEYPDDDHPYGPLRKRPEVLLDLLTDLFTHSWLPPYYDVLAIIDLDHEKS